jgi:hypothetical protein
MASCVDVGWRDGKPSIVSEDVRDFVLAGATQPAATRLPRPRSRNAPKPSRLVNYGSVLRNQMDAFTIKGASGIEQLLVLSNAETTKQFQFFAHSAHISSANCSTAEIRQSATHSTADVAAQTDHSRGRALPAAATLAGTSAAERDAGKGRKAATTKSSSSFMSKMRSR